MKYQISQMDFDTEFASFVDLSHAIYGDKAVTDEAMYRWLFEKNIYNPTGKHFFHIAKDGTKVVASDSLMPVPIIINGTKYIAAWSIKTMTHPDYQRQGIFRALTEYNVSKAKDAGIDIILGFANSNSYPGYKKFGWDILVERRAVVRPLDIRRSLAKRRYLSPFAGPCNAIYRTIDKRRLSSLAQKIGDHVTQIYRTLPSSCQDIWLKMQSSIPIMIERDKNYLDWRYNQRPRQDYHFLLASSKESTEAMIVFRVNPSNGSCIIIDYIGSPDSKALPALVYDTIQHCLKNNIRYIFSSSGSKLDNLLTENFGFKFLKTPLANNMFIAYRLNESIDPKALQQESNWFYSYGDSELDIDLQPR